MPADLIPSAVRCGPSPLALGRLKDLAAVPSLVAALGYQSEVVRLGIVPALDALGWKPEDKAIIETVDASHGRMERPSSLCSRRSSRRRRSSQMPAVPSEANSKREKSRASGAAKTRRGKEREKKLVPGPENPAP